jgi:exosome complex component CSL4
MTEKRMVYPGEELGGEEEFLAGPGTYVEDGKILSAQVGVLSYNEKEHMVFVEPSKPTNQVRDGDVVIAVVDDLKSSMVTLTIERIEDVDRVVMGETHAAIHVAKCSNDYVRELEDVYRITDVVRAKVIQAAPSVQLETRDDEFGVIKARCHVCRQPMVLKDRRLWCEECERWEDRKLSNRYGGAFATGTEHLRATEEVE